MGLMNSVKVLVLVGDLMKGKKRWGGSECISDIKSDQNLGYFKNAIRDHVFKLNNTSPNDDFNKL